ncbi:hypothetical protein RV10_GL001430 [Enterococcus pallens]|nr:hypothetical protein RV10_GL001430 [Enterococcus pallens]
MELATISYYGIYFSLKNKSVSLHEYHSTKLAVIWLDFAA